MSVDPTATPPGPTNTSPPAAPVGTRPAATPAPAPAARPTAAQVSFWQSFFLGRTRPGELPIYHHSNLFYWWPIWLLGFIFAGITWYDDTHMALVPPGTELAAKREVVIDDKGTREERDVLILPKSEPLIKVKNRVGEEVPFTPTIFMDRHKTLGTVFVIVLLIVISITNVTLRGLWSVLVLVVILMLSLIFWAAGWWETILARLGQLAIFINLGGYIVISTVLFVLWSLNFFILDRQTYMIFSPGQLRVRLEIGAGENVYDTAGMVVHKQRSDMFRHWVLGLGSGDIEIRPSGLGYALEMPNVLRVGRRVRQIEEMVKEKEVMTNVSGSPGPPASTL